METDEGLLEKYLEGEEVTGEALEKAFHEAVRRGLLYPVALASGEREIGVLPLLELILEALPPPRSASGMVPLGQGLQGPGGPLYGPGGLPAPLPGKA